MAIPFRYVHAWIRARRSAEASDVGASLVEYALLVGLIAIVCFAAVGFLGEETNSSFEGVGSSFTNP